MELEFLQEDPQDLLAAGNDPDVADVVDQGWGRQDLCRESRIFVNSCCCCIRVVEPSLSKDDSQPELETPL